MLSVNGFVGLGSSNSFDRSDFIWLHLVKTRVFQNGQNKLCPDKQNFSWKIEGRSTSSKLGNRIARKIKQKMGVYCYRK